MVVFYWNLEPKQAQWIALPISVFLMGFDCARLYSRRLNDFFTSLFKSVLRESERGRLAGSTSMMAGVTLILFIFPKSVVLLALLFLAFADPLASYFGIRYGKDKLIGEKSVQGTAAAFVVCFLLSLAYCLHFGLMTDRLFLVCLLAGFAGAVSELVPVWKFDDNFVFPVMSATLLTGIFYVFGGL